jgi:hypothetical protein
MDSLERLVLLGRCGYDVVVRGSWDRGYAFEFNHYSVRVWHCRLEGKAGDVLHGSGEDPALAIAEAFGKALSVDRALADAYVKAMAGMESL